jgi:tagatose-6-phosphate ketose/aldose isomerase
MAYLQLEDTALTRARAIWTAREIEQQPDSWQRTFAMIGERRADIAAFLAPLLARREMRIILTGAGSSAFIGEALAPVLASALKRQTQAIPTTDLLSGPRQYLSPDVPTLLVSFGRSGGSPESVAVVELAERELSECHQLIITCNEQGTLYQRCHGQRKSLALLMPPETHDQSFAMTSSFTSMMLAAWLAFSDGAVSAPVMTRIAESAREILSRHIVTMRDLAARDFSRVVYLGSNGLKAIARESALKLLELTDGRVVATHESSLGFRHGPKTIINAEALVVMFISNDPYTRQYDLDLLRELRADARAGAVFAISAQTGDEVSTGEFLHIPRLDAAQDCELAFAYIICAQLYAFHRALQLGNSPDQPSASGTVSRVVSGVTIHALRG